MAVQLGAGFASNGSQTDPGFLENYIAAEVAKAIKPHLDRIDRIVQQLTKPVAAPVVNIPAPIVHVAAPEVGVNVAAAENEPPEVIVNLDLSALKNEIAGLRSELKAAVAAANRPTVRDVKRGPDGTIQSITERKT